MDETLLSLPKQDIRKLLGAASGDAALLYLYLRMGFDPLQAREALHLPLQTYDCAMASLRQLGLIEEKPRFLQPGQPPVYTEQDVTKEMDSSKSFGQLIGEVQRRLGRVLSTEELKILLSMRDYLRLPDEVISILISFCIDRDRARGNVRAPSMRNIEKEAYHWAELGIDTMEEAIVYMQRQNLRFSRLGQLMTVLQIRGRALTAAEERYAQQWLDWGFDNDAIAMAYERTCLNTGGLSWAYMNKILTRWQSAGLLTAEAIKRGDNKPGNFKAGARQPDSDELAAIEKMFQEV